MAKNEKCAISDSALCKWLDKDCKDCYISGLREKDDLGKMLENFEVTLSLLPDDFDDLQSDECQFCKGEKNKRAGYAIVDLAHIEPESKRGMFFGIGKKVRQRIGSLMPVSISICKDCRRVLRWVEGIKWLSIAVIFAIAVAIVAIPATGDAIVQASEALPYAVIIAGILLGYILGKVASGAYMKAKSEQTCINVFDIPVCNSMKNRGWFLVQDNPDITRFIFSKKSSTKKVADILKKDENPKEDFSQTSFLED
ncbi:MAG: hypothetical protein PHO15_01170 [Eubacteriales bacterium]|nr:hypothetical protein [Eubacteriales bacterium]